MNPAQKKIAVGVFITFFFALVSIVLWIKAVYAIHNFEEKIKLTGDIEPYVRQEVESSNFPSRAWMAYAIRIVKSNKLSPLDAARFYGYVSSIYADVLNASDDSSQASLATEQLINSLFPDNKEETNSILVGLHIKKGGISAKSTDILAIYIQRSSEENYKPNNKQKAPEAENESSKTWITDKNIFVPPPPKKDSIIDRLELKKVRYAVAKRTPDDDEIVFFWDGIDNFLSRDRETVTVAGIWQNILFIETGKSSNDKEYAQSQKLLAEAINDALIVTWKQKYTYNATYPSTRLPNLSVLFSNPPYPSYPSEHAAASFAAQVILDALIPEKKDVWKLHANNAAYSRLIAGINSEGDIKAGEYIGIQAGNAVLDTHPPKAKIVESPTRLVETLTFSGILMAKELLAEKLHAILGQEIQNQTFEEVSEEAGLTDLPIPEHYDGVSWVDYDSDGYLDILINDSLYHNMGDGKFALKRRFPTWGVFGDYNNDGCPDLFIPMTGAPNPKDQKTLSDMLFKNNCNGTFTDVAKSAGIHDTYHGNSATWVDYNNDGLLDIYIANWGITEAERWFYESNNPKQEYIFEPNTLYKNNGDGTFTDVTSKAGLDGTLTCTDFAKKRLALEKNLKPAFQPVWFDYNNDGYPDLFVVMDALISPFYKNNGDGTFTQVTETAGLCTSRSWDNMGASILDFNGDGLLDLYVTNAGKNLLWKNNGDGTFTDVANQVGAQDLGYGWGTETLDYDNDGNTDIVVVNGNSRLRATMYTMPGGIKHNDLDELFKNNGDGTFRAVGKDEGFSISNEIKYSVAAADYNNDGAVDLFIPVSPWRYSTSHSLLFRNRGNKNSWLTIKLIGTKSNHDGIGARLKLTANGKKQIREIQAGASYRSQSSPWPTFGLGKNTKIDTLEIRWPSGITQTFHDLTSNRKIIIKEGSETIIDK